jgi:hypothetical protein
MSKHGTKKRRRPNSGLATITDLLAHCKISTWDALIIGDGSGTGWKMGAGWAAVLIDKYSGARKLFYGAMNTGTVTIGELFPYLHALCWYAGRDGPGRRRRRELLAANRAMQIHIITDSQVIAAAGNNVKSRRAHAELWSVFDAFTRSGFIQTFHFVGRDRVDLNVLVDEVSRQARLDVENTYNSAIATLCKRYPGLPETASIYDFSS